MNLFFDTSALIKRYIDEKESASIESLFNDVEGVYVSTITLIECISTIKRLLKERIITKGEYDIVKNEIENDFQFFYIIQLSEEVQEAAIRLIEDYQLKTLDSIQYASALVMQTEIDGIVTYDKQLIKVGVKENLKTVSPE